MSTRPNPQETKVMASIITQTIGAASSQLRVIGHLPLTPAAQVPLTREQVAAASREASARSTVSPDGGSKSRASKVDDDSLDSAEASATIDDSTSKSKGGKLNVVA
jgi:hypothetical protein